MKYTTEQRIYIRDMERQIITSIDAGFYHTARNQLRDLIAYTEE